MRLIYPRTESVITCSSSSIRSRIDISSKASRISVLLSSPKRSRIAVNSSFMSSISLDSDPNIAFNSATISSKPFCSVIILSFSIPVNRCNLMSKMAWAWISENLNSSINFGRASLASLDPRIILMILSILSRAIKYPSNKCNRAKAFRRSN